MLNHAFALVLLAAVPVLAQEPLDKLLGTWTLNVAKSKIPGPPLASGNMKNVKLAPSMILSIMTSQTKTGEGQERKVTRICDGKERPVEGAAAGITYTCSVQGVVVKRSGQVISDMKVTFSPDGKTQTVTLKRQGQDGAWAEVVSVYEKL